MSHSSDPVVVGVDGSAESMRAVDYGRLEAERRDTSLLLVNTFQPYVPMSPMAPTFSYEIVRDASHAILNDAMRYLLDHPEGRVSVRTRVVQGAVRRALVDQTEAAQLMVLGRREVSAIARAIIGSTIATVAAKAQCPVVVVPKNWVPTNHGRVVVGVDGTTHSIEAVWHAFEEASRRDAELIAIHAWTAFDYYVSLPAMANARVIWRQNAELSLGQSMAGLEEQFPDVKVRRIVDDRAPVEALLDAATEADLVVLGTRSRGGAPRWALGSVARTVMTEAGCPVVVVQHDQRVRQYDAVVEHASTQGHPAAP